MEWTRLLSHEGRLGRALAAPLEYGADGIQAIGWNRYLKILVPHDVNRWGSGRRTGITRCRSADFGDRLDEKV
ncbi:MAG TPA: hypothetical protein EYO78_12670 [Gammaproteobacteria bacterium]|nr:hypothetical protein [Gammaproteobacteria bacterium]